MNTRSTSLADSVRVPKTAELVAANIRRRIVRGELKAGDSLAPESTLMEDFSISRPTLRESFRILESEGLITVRRGARGGARVQVPTTEVAARYAGLVLQHRGTTLADVFAARVVVEAPVPAILARRSDHTVIAAKLRLWIKDHTDADAHELESEFYAAFNRLLVELTGNESLNLLANMLETISDAATASYITVPNPDEARMTRRATRTRAQLIDLIEVGDEVAAEELWRKYLTEQGQILMGSESQTVVDLLS